MTQFLFADYGDTRADHIEKIAHNHRINYGRTVNPANFGDWITDHEVKSMVAISAYPFEFEPGMIEEETWDNRVLMMYADMESKYEYDMDCAADEAAEMKKVWTYSPYRICGDPDSVQLERANPWTMRDLADAYYSI